MPLRVGIVGCADPLAQTLEMRGVQDRVQITVAVDTDRKAAVSISSRYPGCRPSGAFEDMAAEIDAAVILTPPHTRSRLGAELLGSGKHVLIAPPAALSLFGMRRLVSAARRTDSSFVIGRGLEAHPLVQHVRDVVNSGRLGAVVHASVRVEQPTVSMPRRRSVRSDERLLSVATPHMRLFHSLWGTPVDGHVQHSAVGIRNFVATDALLRFSCGTIAHILVTHVPETSSRTHVIELQGSEGTLQLDAERGLLEVTSRTGDESVQGPSMVEFGVSVADFVDEISRGSIVDDYVPDNVQALNDLQKVLGQNKPWKHVQDTATTQGREE